MSPRKRNKENQGLPERWRFKHNAYYYQVPKHLRPLWDNKVEFPLGKTLIEAYRVWAMRAEIYSDAKTIGDGLQRYLLEVVPLRSQSTQDNYTRLINKFILPVFREMPIASLQPVDIYRFRDKLGKTSMYQAKSMPGHHQPSLYQVYRVGTDRHTPVDW